MVLLRDKFKSIRSAALCLCLSNSVVSVYYRSPPVSTLHRICLYWSKSEILITSFSRFCSECWRSCFSLLYDDRDNSCHNQHGVSAHLHKTANTSDRILEAPVSEMFYVPCAKNWRRIWESSPACEFWGHNWLFTYLLTQSTLFDPCAKIAYLLPGLYFQFALAHLHFL